MPLSLNPQQKEAAEAPEKPLLIIAGAGTGKTRTLTARISSLIERGTPGESILAITFTNKAANEMRTRVMKERFMQGKEPLIATFHSLCASILRREARFTGRTAGFVIFDEHDAFALLKKVIKNFPRNRTTPATARREISKYKEGVTNELESPYKEIMEAYDEALSAHDAFDFDDLIQKTVLLFQIHPDRLSFWQKRFSHVLVDEYQDVNPIQCTLVELLAGAHSHVSVVGDAAQTIYSWRGSDIDAFLSFPKRWPESQTHVLKENYRSTPQIIEAASALIAKSSIPLRGSGELVSGKKAGTPVSLISTESEYEEAAWIAKDIAQKTLREKSIGILYRTNAQSRALETALLEAGLPYRVFGGLRFYERREIKDVIAGLRAATNPNDSISRERLEKAFGKRVTRPLLEDLRTAGTLPPSLLIKRFLETARYREYLSREVDNILEREENLAELTRFAENFEDMALFLERVALLETPMPKERHVSAPITLMTIHLAKGLEFDDVYVVGVNEGLLPHIRSFETMRELEEERRLLYVAMTRAKENLVLSFYDLPSRFLNDIPQELLVLKDTRGESFESFELDNEERYITL